MKIHNVTFYVYSPTTRQQVGRCEQKKLDFKVTIRGSEGKDGTSRSMLTLYVFSLGRELLVDKQWTRIIDVSKCFLLAFKSLKTIVMFCNEKLYLKPVGQNTFCPVFIMNKCKTPEPGKWRDICTIK